MFGNAVKFTANRDEARIEFGQSHDASGTRNPTPTYYIRDNGAGFDQQYVGKLFHAFQRLHGDKDFSGSGIGLATVARVIRRHQGTLRAEGTVGQGATFWFTLG
jgi:light-regulated signal transduction histidine kinase (bacteriophytochrome)